MALAVTAWAAMAAAGLPPRDRADEPAADAAPALVDLAAPSSAVGAIAFGPEDVPPPEEGPAPDSEAGPEPVEHDSCAAALTWVTAAGLSLPPGVGYHCPSTEFAHHGAACWNGTFCPASGFIAINLDLIGGRSTAYLRRVIAHEICHIGDFQATGRTTEAGADACADRHLALLDVP